VADNKTFFEKTIEFISKYANPIKWLGYLFDAIARSNQLLKAGEKIISGLLAAGNAVEGVLKTVPPIHAIFVGFVAIAEAVESVFLSKESQDLRFIKALNAIFAAASSITTFTLWALAPFSPVAPLISSCSSLIATIKEGYLFYEYDKKASETADPVLKRAFETKRDESKWNAIKFGFSTVGFACLTVISFAALGAVALNPVGAFVLASVATVCLVGPPVVSFFSKAYNWLTGGNVVADEPHPSPTVAPVPAPKPKPKLTQNIHKELGIKRAKTNASIATLENKSDSFSETDKVKIRKKLKSDLDIITKVTPDSDADTQDTTVALQSHINNIGHDRIDSSPSFKLGK